MVAFFSWIFCSELILQTINEPELKSYHQAVYYIKKSFYIDFKYVLHTKNIDFIIKYQMNYYYIIAIALYELKVK